MTKTYQEILDEIEADRELKAKLADSQRNQLVIAMLAAGVAKVHIEFYGSGDSGCIEDPMIEMKDGYEEPAGLSDELREWADTLLEGTGIDWYNNDGGQGELNFDLTTVPPHFSGNVDYNETISHTGAEWDEGAIEGDVE